MQNKQRNGERTLVKIWTVEGRNIQTEFLKGREALYALIYKHKAE